MAAANVLQVEEPRNLPLGDFLYTWAVVDARRINSISNKRKRSPNMKYLESLSSKKIKEVKRSDLENERCDFQGIDWERLEVTRSEGRFVRKKTYKAYHNPNTPKDHTETLRQHQIDSSQNYFQFRRMDFAHKPLYAHFQLRNQIACTSQNSVYYAGRAKVYQTRPLFSTKHLAMDLTDPYVTPANPGALTQPGISITTLAADHGVLIVGGYGGEYALSSLNSTANSHVEGIVTDNVDNHLINHVDIIQSRRSHTPQAVFSCNDKGLRILDTQTDTFVHEHIFDWPVNGSATSPDARLRVLIGDDPRVLIVDAETSKVVQSLPGQLDHGFACAWADNGYHVATASQDRMINIWDARMWTDVKGGARPLKSVATHFTAARSLKFSPVGSGQRVLVAAENADIVSIIDAETYSTKQHLEFYGEISGVAFSPDGQGLVVGITDWLRGGIMEFDRCNKGEKYSSRRLKWCCDGYDETDQVDSRWEMDENRKLASSKPANVYKYMDSGLDWKPTVEESAGQGKAKRTAMWHRRHAAVAGDEMPSW